MRNELPINTWPGLISYAKTSYYGLPLILLALLHVIELFVICVMLRILQNPYDLGSNMHQLRATLFIDIRLYNCTGLYQIRLHNITFMSHPVIGSEDM